MKPLVWIALVVATAWQAASAGPSHVDITWFSIANVYYDFGAFGVVTDGYISRIAEQDFFGGGGGLAETRGARTPDRQAVARVLSAFGGPSRVNLLLTGHSHFNHSFDTATWAALTGAPVVGSRTTCFQVQAEYIPPSRCQPVDGGERIPVTTGVTMFVVRWNHSGDPAVNPEQHNPVELHAPPMRDPATGGLRAGVAEDFPNGGGNRAFLFVVDGPSGRFSWFYQNSASAVDLHLPIVVDRKDFGAPIDNLRRAMREAGLTSVDLWIGTGGAPIARLLLPVLKPKAYLPVHWDGLYGAFAAGVPRPFQDAPLEQVLMQAGVTLLRPMQYMDKWRLDRAGVRSVPNVAVQSALGFARPPAQ